jgi:predicted TIM-barrel fold metal-dependent hydrolase
MITDFSCQQRDLDIFYNELNSFLPSKIIDGHVHLWNKKSINIPRSEYEIHKRYKPWTDFDLFEEFTIEDYYRCANALLPGKDFIGTFFGLPFEQIDRGVSNQYILEQSKNECFGFYYMPGQFENAYETEQKLALSKINGFLGLKPYPDLAKVEGRDVGLYDMLNRSFLEYAHEFGLHIMLHIPGKMRLKDERLKTELIETVRKYKNATFIMAHAGRSFCFYDINGSIDFLINEENVLFDTALLNDPLVLEYLFKSVDSTKILFGTDAPLSFTKGKDVCINNKHYYVADKVVPWGIGPIDENLLDLTYYLYEEIRSIIYAVKAAYPNNQDKSLENIFYNNSKNIYLQHGLI